MSVRPDAFPKWIRSCWAGAADRCDGTPTEYGTHEHDHLCFQPHPPVAV